MRYNEVRPLFRPKDAPESYVFDVSKKAQKAISRNSNTSEVSEKSSVHDAADNHKNRSNMKIATELYLTCPPPLMRSSCND